MQEQEETATGRKRSYDPVGMRGRLLDVAAEAFQADGYHSTSMHDIMRKAGVTGGALYHHFPTKKALGLAVIHERVVQAVEAACIEPVTSARRVSEGVLAVFDQVAAGLEDRGKVLGCPLNNLAIELSLVDPEFRRAVETVFEKWRLAIAERVRREQAGGAAKELDPEIFAAFAVAAFSGAMAQAKASQTTAPLRACAGQLAQLLRPLGRSPRSR